MRTFECDSCGGALFFENDTCLACSKHVGFCSDELRMWTVETGAASGLAQCRNWTEYAACNWFVAAGAAAEPGYCAACMRVIEIYQQGDFPKLVVESKKDFARDYGLRAEYWRHFDVNESPEVLSFLKTNLRDLANHYHSLYQDEALAGEKPANYREALAWYREFLVSFPQDSESPSINYQVADLLLENKDFAEAAAEYERTAYDYARHERSSAAGYAAIYAHREYLNVVADAQMSEARRATVTSSLKFADTFPEHEHAPAVLGAAAQDVYEMKDFPLARESARKLVDRYPSSEVALRRPAWTIVAHSSFELADFPAAEAAYAHGAVPRDFDRRRAGAQLEGEGDVSDG